MDKNLKNNNPKIKVIKILVFGAALFIFFVIGLLGFLRPNYSEIEKRDLTKHPRMSWSRFISGNYFDQYTAWYSDTYPLREALMSGNLSLERKFGFRGTQIVSSTTQVGADIPENAEGSQASPGSGEIAEGEQETAEVGTIEEVVSGVFLEGDAGYEMYYFNQNGADSFTSVLNEIYENNGELVNIYTMVVPTSAGAILDHEDIDNMGASDQKKVEEYIFGKLNEGIHAVPIIDALNNRKTDYIYFDTDSHWTQLGAYYAYLEFCDIKGITPTETTEHKTYTAEGFKGNLGAQAPSLQEYTDTVTGYIPVATNDMKLVDKDANGKDWWVIDNVTNLQDDELYSIYGGGDNAFSSTHNEEKADGSAVLVIKDSYGNAFVPWLVDNYEYVYWVDVKYTSNTITQMINDCGIQDVIVLMGVYDATSEQVAARLRAIGK